MKKVNNFKILWHYLKDDKFKLFLYVLLAMLTYLPTILAAFFWGKALEYLLLKQMKEFILFLGLWEALYIVFYAILQIPRDYVYNYLELKFMKNVSTDLYKKMVDLPSIAFEEMGSGEFINRLYTDPERVMELLAKLIKVICKIIVVFIVIFICFNVSILLGIEIVIFAICMGVISYVFFPRIKKMQENIKKQSDEYVKIATEDVAGIREIKSLGIKNNIKDRVYNKLTNLFGYSKKIRVYETFYYNINSLIYFILQFIILFTTGYLFMQGKLEYSVFVMIEMYIWRIDEVVESLSDFGVNYNKVSVSLKRIDEIVNNRLYKDEKYGNIILDNPNGIVEFKDVTFKYKEDENNILNGLSLKIEPNKKTAIVGRSGNGKSTIFNLLLRYFYSNDCEILIDGINIKDLNEESLRNNISIIRQMPFLFNLSIMDNFRLVKNDISLEEVREVCKKAYIDEYIMSLPNKYETIIGEGGINLSGGQNQRLAIARTLVLNTKIILFDEATSALDNESQEYIKKTINDLVKDHTIIIVAHRLSTIVDADIINVIDKGTLLASGTHNKLMRTCKMYKNLYKNENLNDEE